MADPQRRHEAFDSRLKAYGRAWKSRDPQKAAELRRKRHLSGESLSQTGARSLWYRRVLVHSDGSPREDPL